MNKYYCWREGEYITTRRVPGLSIPMVHELSCPARFNPMERKWTPKDGVNPHECPLSENFMHLLEPAWRTKTPMNSADDWLLKASPPRDAEDMYREYRKEAS
jgi:hypothetical protein